MRWGVALRVVCVALAMMAGGLGRAPAQDTDDPDEDGDRGGAASDSHGLRSKAYPDLFLSTKSFDILSGGNVMPHQWLYFAGADIWHSGAGAHAGVQWEPAQYGNNTFIFRFLSADSFERYRGDNRRYDTHTARVTLLPGVKFQRGNIEIQLLAGIEQTAELRSVDDHARSLRFRTGWRASAELWWEPTRSTMVSTSFSATNIFNGANWRAAAGWRVRDWFWAGPEFAVSGDALSQQQRVGIHLTGFRGGTEYFEWSVGAGYVEDSFQRRGGYGRLTMLIRTRPSLFSH